jgi:hypothetical protein
MFRSKKSLQTLPPAPQIQARSPPPPPLPRLPRGPLPRQQPQRRRCLFLRAGPHPPPSSSSRARDRARASPAGGGAGRWWRWRPWTHAWRGSRPPSASSPTSPSQVRWGPPRSSLSPLSLQPLRLASRSPRGWWAGLLDSVERSTAAGGGAAASR